MNLFITNIQLLLKRAMLIVLHASKLMQTNPFTHPHPSQDVHLMDWSCVDHLRIIVMFYQLFGLSL